MLSKALTLTAACLLFASPSFALIILDEAMSKEDQKRTGVANLTFDQKKNLETWLNQHCELKSSPQPAQQKTIYLSLIIDNGQKVQLSDGSVWEVDPTDIQRASLWVTAGALKIVPSGNPNYPCLLVDTSTGISIKVKKQENATLVPTQ